MEDAKMEPMPLEKSELLTLLDLMGIEEVVGLGSDLLPAPEPFERSIILDDGRSRLLERGRLSVADDHYEIESDLEAMLAIVGDPKTVLRVHRGVPDSHEELWCWYFISATHVVQLATSNPEQFELGWMSDLDSVLTQISEIFPLETMPDEVRYQAVADQEDANQVSTLVSGWEEVPALTIMEADGLTPVEAIELYDDLVEPMWRGRIDFMACSSGQVTINHRLLLLQGQSLAWFAWQDGPSASNLHIQTAIAGALQEHLMTYLADVAPE
jgi:hypothetical protein